MSEIIRYSQQVDPESWPEIRAALLSLHPRQGDIWLVDATQVDVDQLCKLQIPEITWPLPIILATPKEGMSVEDVIRTCDLTTLKRIVAEMEAEK